MDFRSQLNYLQQHPGFRAQPLTTLARLVRWRVHCLTGRSATIRLPHAGLRFHLPPSWRGMAKTVYVFGDRYYEPELLFIEALLQPGQVFVDVGASLGLYTVLGANRVGQSGRVVAVEAAAAAFAQLQRNIRLNGLNMVHAIHAAAAETDGRTRLYCDPDPDRNTTLPSGVSTPRAYEDVAARSIDSLLEELGCDHVDVIKIDVEGAEELVLRGASDGLRDRPTVLFECNTPDTWHFLRNLGYRLCTLTDYGALRELTSVPLLGTNVLALGSALQAVRVE
jgi:FkbM family methyltransferase